jgi:hypothetical protein
MAWSLPKTDKDETKEGRDAMSPEYRHNLEDAGGER